VSGPFDEIADLVADSLRDVERLRPAVLVRQASTMRVPGQPSGGTNPSQAEYACEGFVTSTSLRFIGGTAVSSGDSVIRLMRQTLAVVPRLQDRVRINGREYRVLGVDVGSDVSAGYTLLVKE
jgi:hypothetical protein